MSNLATVLVTALTTLIIAVTAAFVGARLQSNRERENWLRDKRYEASVLIVRSLDWRDLQEKVDAQFPTDLPPPVDINAAVDVLGMVDVGKAARACEAALSAIFIRTQSEDWTSDELYAMQAVFDAARVELVKQINAILGVTTTDRN
jgi:hypothetical protein